MAERKALELNWRRHHYGDLHWTARLGRYSASVWYSGDSWYPEQFDWTTHHPRNGAMAHNTASTLLEAKRQAEAAIFRSINLRVGGSL